MTPKEKAKQLYNKMKFETECNSQPSTVHGMCKKLSLVCVDEILEGSMLVHVADYNYWQDVKQEINKINKL